MMPTTHKLALGTVQFGLRYGVANAMGQVPPAEARRILAIASAHGIDTLDTAIAYGDSESCLGTAHVDAFKIVTKLPPLPADCPDIARWIRAHVEGSLARLNIGQVEAVLLHRSADIVGPHANAYQTTLAALKSEGLCQATGVSIYAPAELDTIWRHGLWRPDLIQTPLNVLDRRMINSGWLARLRRENIRVHARSAFLQGLLLMSPEKRPAWFLPWTDLLDRWTNWCASVSLNPLQVALRFACAQEGVEKVVFGVDAASQLEEIVRSLDDTAPLPPLDLQSEDVNLIDPSRWNLS